MADLFLEDEAPVQPEKKSFDESTGYLVLQLADEPPGSPKAEVRFGQKTFQPKSELHITILSREAAEEIKNYLEQNPEELEVIKSLVNETDWSFRKRNQFYRVVESPKVESIIQTVEIPGLISFIKALSEKIGVDLEPPPAHITLYTLGDPKGIGIPTNESFQQLVREEVNMGDLESVEPETSEGEQHD